MVDLIPAEYHRALRMQRLLRGFGCAALCLAAGMGLAGAGLAYGISGERTALARFKHMQAQAKAQQARLAEVTGRRDQAREQLRALDALRGGAAVGSLAAAVDAALIDQVWFQELTFAHGEAVERKAEAGRPGEASTAANGAAMAKAGESTRFESARAEIRGIAGNHPALAEFVMRVAAQSGVAQAKLIDTSARTYPGIQVVDFRLALVLDGAPGAVQ